MHHGKNNGTVFPLVPRRTVLAVSAILGSLFYCDSNTNVAHAACLYGDLSPECIGVYKVPLDNNEPAIREMLGNSDAPPNTMVHNVHVPAIAIPKSVREARTILEAQRLVADEISTVVLAGRLEQAGIQVLQLLPPLTVSGRVVLDHAMAARMTTTTNTNTDSDTVVAELRRERSEQLFSTVVVAWNTVDITIGQGLRGALGVSAVAQLLILDALREATGALDDFLLEMPLN